MFNTKDMKLIVEGCVFIRKIVFQKFPGLLLCVMYIMYTWNVVTPDKTIVYLFVLKSGNQITIHADCVSDRYQI